MGLKFFKCEICGNIVEMIHDSGNPIVCCGKNMTELVPGTVDASLEKHVPAVKVEGNTVSVQIGEVKHPMLDEHHIEWVAIETKKGSQRKTLKPGDEPVVTFILAEGDELIATYEYCNIHGLWKK